MIPKKQLEEIILFARIPSAVQEHGALGDAALRRLGEELHLRGTGGRAWHVQS